jgi:hypothetical protein
LLEVKLRIQDRSRKCVLDGMNVEQTNKGCASLLAPTIVRSESSRQISHLNFSQLPDEQAIFIRRRQHFQVLLLLYSYESHLFLYSREVLEAAGSLARRDAF